MNLNWNLNPLEISRKLHCFYQDCLLDFEIRHPETRRRLALHLKMELSSNDRPLFEALIQRFASAKMVISIFDWPVLFEWNEWRLQAETLIAIQKRLQIATPVSENPIVASKLRDRLQEILSLIRENVLEDQASLLQCIRYRWKYSGLRQETQYYLERLDQLQSPGALAS